MDFRLSEEADKFREEARAFLAEQITHELEEKCYRTGVSHDDDFTKAVVEKGWFAPHWPEEYGGLGFEPMMMQVLHREMRVVDAPTYGMGTSAMIAAVVREVGTDEQKQRIIPAVLRGEMILVLGFTEPECGSDVFAAATKAVRDGDEWVINGSKMFTTNAQIGSYVFLLARTNTEVAKHKGLTMFLVPMDAEGVEVQAVHTISGERTNITYYNDVRISDEWRIGEVDGGYAVMNVALGLEHGGGFGAGLERIARAFEQWAKETDNDEGGKRIDDDDVRLCLGRTLVDTEVSFLLQQRCGWMAESGVHTVAEGPMAKMLSSELLEDRAEEVIQVMGPDGMRSYFDPTAPVNGTLEHMLRFSLGTTIYAGTSEVHRNMIAQRGLGLPRR